MNRSWSFRSSLLLATTVALCVLTGNALAAQKAKGATEPAPGAATASQPDYDAILKPLHFREIGPASMGGRIDDFAVVESNPDIIYVGAASGGVFKTTNAGTTWEPVFDDQPNSTIGDV